MKVLVVSRHYIRPGAMTGAVVHNQCVELARAGIEVEVICPIPRLPSLRALPGLQGGRRRSKRIDGVSVTYVPYTNVPNRWSTKLSVASLRRAIWRSVRALPGAREADILHAHMLFPTGAACLDVAKRLGIPILVTTHGSDTHTNPYRNKGIAAWTRKAIANSDRVVAVSKQLAKEVAKLARPSDQVRIVYNGVDIEMFRPCTERRRQRAKLGLPLHGVGICTVGRLVAEKGVGDLMRAFGGLARHDRKIWLAFVGDGPARSMVEAWAAQEGVAERVFISGSLPHDEIPSWLGASDIFALASYREGFPSVILEAMACGQPVVSTDVGGIPEAVGSGTAILVPPRQAKPLAEALSTLIGSSSLRERMGNEGLKRVRANFTWAHSAADLARNYGELVPGEPSRPGDPCGRLDT